MEDYVRTAENFKEMAFLEKECLGKDFERVFWPKKYTLGSDYSYFDKESNRQLKVGLVNVYGMWDRHRKEYCALTALVKENEKMYLLPLEWLESH